MEGQQQQQLQQQPKSMTISTSLATATTSTGVVATGLQARPGYAILIKDERNNTVRLVQTSAKPMMSRPAATITPTTTANTTTTSTAPATSQQHVHYVSASGLTKEAGLELASQIAAFKTQSSTKGATHAVVAVPISTPSIKTTPVKTEPTILPKPAPGNAQRVVALAASPKTPSSSPSTGGGDNLAAAAAAAWASKRGHDYAEAEITDFTKRTKRVFVGGGLGLGSGGAGKGLRHFSMKVCEKVQRKGVTSYNEVADELVAEFSDPQRSLSPTDQAYDQKNIRRRVYDALNVLMAMNIISKEKKEIRWLGLPTNSAQECENLELEKNTRLDRIRVKTQHLHELILQQIAFKNLVQRNKQLEKANGTPMANSAIHLPFIIVNTSKKTVIDCSISSDKMEYLFSFDNTFEIHDDIEVLKRMGMTHGLERGGCPPGQLDKLKKMVPKSLENYVGQIAEGGTSRLTSTSIVAGPSGLVTGRPVTVLKDNASQNSRIQDIEQETSRLCVQAMTEDAESMDTPTNSMQMAMSSDEEEFSESEMEAEDDEDIMVDIN